MVKSVPKIVRAGMHGRVLMNGRVTRYGTVLIATGNVSSLQAINMLKTPGLSIEVSCDRDGRFVQVYPQ